MKHNPSTKTKARWIFGVLAPLGAAYIYLPDIPPVWVILVCAAWVLTAWKLKIGMGPGLV